MVKTKIKLLTLDNALLNGLGMINLGINIPFMQLVRCKKNNVNLFTNVLFYKSIVHC